MQCKIQTKKQRFHFQFSVISAGFHKQSNKVINFKLSNNFKLIFKQLRLSFVKLGTEPENIN